jgi:hypothetical protein
VCVCVTVMNDLVLSAIAASVGVSDGGGVCL